MRFPTEKMSHVTVYQGNKSEEGWLVLDIGNMELEGVSKIYVDLRDVEEVKRGTQRKSDALKKARDLLGG